MVPRALRMPTLLAASVAVPYVASNAPEWARDVKLPSFASSSAAPATPELLPLAGPGGAFSQAPPLRPLPTFEPPKAPGSEIIPVSTPLEGYPTYSANDVFRMDVTKEWVYQRWPRKSTSLGTLDLYGVRVPLVTGPQLHDLAGALTYYFGPSGRVERITFRGRTGDTTQIVTVATQRFGLTRQPSLTPAEQLFQYHRDKDVICELRTRPAPVLWESSPHDSFSVELDLQQIDTGKPIVAQLPPLSAKASPAAPPAPAQAAAEAPSKPAEASLADQKSDEKSQGWRAFFPRSRVPKNQLDDLNMPRQLW